MSMEMLAQMIPPPMDAQSIVVEIPSCAHPKKMPSAAWNHKNVSQQQKEWTMLLVQTTLFAQLSANQMKWNAP